MVPYLLGKSEVDVVPGMASSALQMQGRVGSELRRTRPELLMLPDRQHGDR